MNVGRKVKEFREKKKMNQVELAKAVGVSPPMINQIERGTRNPSIQTGYLIAEVLGCSIEDLLN